MCSWLTIPLMKFSQGLNHHSAASTRTGKLFNVASASAQVMSTDWPRGSTAIYASAISIETQKVQRHPAEELDDTHKGIQLHQHGCMFWRRQGGRLSCTRTKLKQIELRRFPWHSQTCRGKLATASGSELRQGQGHSASNVRLPKYLALR